MAVTKPIRVAVVGLGKIARDQHLPAIAGDERYSLAATVSPDDPALAGIPHHSSLATLLAARPALDAVVLCTPPQVRYELAMLALARGLHVFLEKPPGATVCEVETLREEAGRRGTTLFAGWHSRFAPAVAPARAWLAAARIRRVTVTWREDVRTWHPGQGWIWEPGGLGVFDPGINALSILTHVLPRPFVLTGARLAFPANRAAPIAAALTFQDTAGVPILMDLDWRQSGPPIWDIIVETDVGTLKLQSGGALLSAPAGPEPAGTKPAGAEPAGAEPAGARYAEAREYPSLYERFATLIHDRSSEVDARPLQLVGDAFLCARRESVAAFHD
ncbi:MAG TPA: Gfo/Idh/MocA family oxidoreductase [Steroidobacteraceae bacterium]|nr:Gfo/Idh/MocA family oxidoreductase [Steroidobacteraceae bacterium]